MLPKYPAGIGGYIICQWGGGDKVGGEDEGR